MAELELHNVTKSYGSVDVIRDVNLSVDAGEFIVLVGPSGCGKSTLLRCIAGLDPISSGRLSRDGVDITRSTPVERGVAMVFQSYALYPHMSVAENIGFGMKIGGAGKAEIGARVIEIAKLLKLTPLLDRKPKALSGGQRQRVAIGRALARSPRLFLFDEPLSNLDAALRGEMRVEIAKLHASLGSTMIYVTHDQVEGMTLAGRMVIMNGGVIEQDGPPLQLFNEPETKFVACFLGQPPMNILKVDSAAREDGDAVVSLMDSLTLRIPLDTRAVHLMEALEVGVRPEDVTLAAPGAGLPCRLDVVEHLGNETILHGRLADGQPIVVRLAGQSPHAMGDIVNVGFSAERAILFDADGRNIRRRSSQ